MPYSNAEFLILGCMLLFTVIPPLSVMLSGRVHDFQKMSWTIIVLFTSWPGLVLFFYTHKRSHGYSMQSYDFR